MLRSARAALPLLLTAALLAAPAAADQLRERALNVFGVIPTFVPNPDNPDSEAKVQLGRSLYFDKRLSKSQEISCNSCHPLDRFGADGEPTSPGHKGQRGARNSPSVYNAALQIAQFWDGRAPDVEAQAKGPVENPVEMAMPSASYVERVLRSIPGYQPMFAKAFPGEKQPVSFDNMALAIADFERHLMTPSPFDDYLAGNDSALTAAQKKGLETFMNVGCITCHNGAGIGGRMFQKMGLIVPYETKDAGRYDVTKVEADRGVFKVPSLRNVTKTAPYFSDGSIKTLPEAVRLMGKHQLGRDLTDEQVDSIISFLGSLVGRVPKALTTPPTLPKSGPTTPKPDLT